MSDIFNGRVFSVSVKEVTHPNGKTGIIELVNHNGGVCVLAVLDNGTVPLVRQLRYGAQKELLELPAGKLELGESPEECGRRELIEECGLAADTFISLGKIHPTPAYCSEVIYMYLARGLTETDTHLDDEEFLSVEYVTLERLREMCLNGEIDDAKTIAAVFRSAMLLDPFSQSARDIDS